MLHTSKVACVAGLMILTLLLGANLNAGQPLPGEIACPGSASYRVGAGPRVTPSKGLYPVALPIELKTKADPCRVVIAGQCLIEAGTSCTLNFSQVKAGEFLLRIEKGAAIYMLETSATLKIETSPHGPSGVAGAAGHKTRHLGIVKASPDGQTAWVNLEGDLKVTEEKSTARPVPAMNRLSLGSGRAAEIAPLLAKGNEPGHGKAPHATNRLPLTLESWKITSISPLSIDDPAMARLKGATPRHPHDVGPIAPNQLDDER